MRSRATARRCRIVTGRPFLSVSALLKSRGSVIVRSLRTPGSRDRPPRHASLGSDARTRAVRSSLLLLRSRLDGESERLRERGLDLIALRDPLELLGVADSKDDRALRSAQGDALLRRVDSDDIGDDRHLAADHTSRPLARLGPLDGCLLRARHLRAPTLLQFERDRLDIPGVDLVADLHVGEALHVGPDG